MLVSQMMILILEIVANTRVFQKTTALLQIMDFFETTVWKFKNFSSTQILREIIFVEVATWLRF